MLAEELAHAGADRRPDDLQGPTVVDGKLHLPGAVHTNARLGVHGELAEKPGQPAQAHVLLIYHPLLAQGDNLFADGEDVPLLIEGGHVPLHQVDVVFADLDEVGLDGVAGEIAVSHLDGDVFAVVYLKLHVRDPFIFICKVFIVDNGF